MDKKEIKIHVTEKDYEKIKEKAIAKGMSVKAYSEFAVLHRRDRRRTPEVAQAVYTLFEMLEEIKDVLSGIERQMTRLNEEPEHGDPLYNLALEDLNLSFRRLARDVTELTKTISGELDNGNS